MLFVKCFFCNFLHIFVHKLRFIMLIFQCRPDRAHFPAFLLSLQKKSLLTGRISLYGKNGKAIGRMIMLTIVAITIIGRPDFT